MAMPSIRILPELLQPIFSHVSNLRSLDNLLRASPTAFGHFNAYGADVFEAVLSSRQIHKHTCALIRIAALVRSSSLPPQVRGLTSFADFLRQESTSHRYDPPVWKLPPTRLTPAVPVTTLLDILATQRKIDCLVTGCLTFYLNRFTALRPRHLVDQSFSFTGIYHGEISDGYYIGAWQQTPEETPFPVHDIGPPTWIEEQRILRAFWRVQLFHDLKAVVGNSCFGWPDADLEELDNMDVVDLYNPRRSIEMNIDDVNFDFDVIEKFGPGSLEGIDISEHFDNIFNSDRKHKPELIMDETTEPMLYQQHTLLENELIWSVEDYVKEDAQTIAAADFQQTKRDWPGPSERENDWTYLSYHNSVTHAFFYAVGGRPSSHELSGGCSPLQHVPFEPFRRLGFAIWSIERMVGYGFLSPDCEAIYDENKCFTHSSVLNAWRSILGKDVLAEVARENLARKEEIHPGLTRVGRVGEQ